MRQVAVELERAAADFPAIVASPTFAVVPPTVDAVDALSASNGFVGSGGCRLVRGRYEMVLEASPALLGRLAGYPDHHARDQPGGRQPGRSFEAGDLDYISISSADARWIAYDKALGPRLLTVHASTDYYGFDTTKPPFDDVRVRKAFGAAVDWRQIAPGRGRSGRRGDLDGPSRYPRPVRPRRPAGP